MLKNIKPIHYLISIFLLSLLYAFISMDTLPFKYADIFDEKNYVAIVKNFPRLLRSQTFTPYYNSRLLVPAIGHCLFRILNIEYTLTNIEAVFLALNFLSIVVAIYYYFKIAQIKKYSQSTTILGFCFLFVNFFILKFSNFYPILMDVFGFTSGVILYYYYLAKNKFKFYSFLLIFMFIFPTTILIVLALITANFIVFNEKGIEIKKHIKTYRLVIFIPIILSLLYFYYHNYDLLILKTASDFSIQSAAGLIPVTIFLLGGFIFLALKYILPLLDKIYLNLKGYSSSQFIFPVGILVIYFLVSKYLSFNFHGQNTLSLEKFLFNIAQQATSFPLKFLITHFIYYGAFIIFILYFHRIFFSYMRKTDSFQKIILIIFILFSLGTETRQFLQLYPFVIILFLDSIKEYKFNIKLLIGIFAFQLVWSRFWYTINSPEGFLTNAFPGPNFLEFPSQRYFQFQGPWLSTNNSMIYGGILLITYIIFRKILKLYLIEPQNITVIKDSE